MSKQFTEVNGIKLVGRSGAPADIADGDIYYDTSTNSFKQKSNGTVSNLGSGSGSGGINYVANPGADVDTTGWLTYADTAKNIPADGTGGSPNSTWTRTTSSPLRGTAAFLWTKSGAANRQGEGVGYNFTIDAADQGRVLSVSFDYKVASGTFTAGDGITAPLNDNTTSTNAGNSDLEVFVYDVTNGALLFVGPETLTSTSTLQAKFQGLFTASSTSTSYRLVIHTATTTTNNFTVQFDNFIVGPQLSPAGFSGNDWAPYTPTLTSGGGGAITLNATGKTDPIGWYKFNGDSTEIWAAFKNGSGGGATGNAGAVFFGLPSGVAFDSVKLANFLTSGAELGHSQVLAGGTSFSYQQSVSQGTGATVQILKNATGGTISVADITASTSIVVYAKIPTSGRSSNVTMDSSVRTAPTVQRFTTGTAQTYTTPAGVKFLKIRMIGAGGGGGGSGTAGTGAAGTGGNTTWATAGGSTIVQAGQGAGSARASGGGAGGTNTFNSPAIKLEDAIGGDGQGYSNAANGNGPQGGSSAVGGGGAGGSAGGTGIAAKANTGSGGGGGALGATGSSGGGGGSGGYVEFILTNPSATYQYSVGALGSGGAAGTSGFTGGNGADGVIEVEEHYLNQGTISSDPVAPTQQRFTTGSGTYTLPVTRGKVPLYIRVRMVGGGGGGMGSATTSFAAAGSAGGNTTFGTSLLTANGGSGGSGASGVGGPGGSATINSPAVGTAVIGGNGGPSSAMTGVGFVARGGDGAPSPFGGQGGGAYTGAGGTATANSGSGGGGGGINNALLSLSGAGGGAGGYIDAVINNPSTTYSYSVGGSGTHSNAGTNGQNGGDGAAGYIEVTEYYQ